VLEPVGQDAQRQVWPGRIGCEHSVPAPPQEASSSLVTGSGEEVVPGASTLRALTQELAAVPSMSSATETK
jgi:hypothetical protein